MIAWVVIDRSEKNKNMINVTFFFFFFNIKTFPDFRKNKKNEILYISTYTQR